MSDVFIAHASASKGQAQRLAKAVRALGYEVWWDDELPPHRAYAEVIEERLKDAKAVLVVWSADAVHSQWVRAEADYARSAGKLVQLVVDDAVPPLPFNQIQCADFRRWKGEAAHPEWRKVAASLAEIIARDDTLPQPVHGHGRPADDRPARRMRFLAAWAALGLAALVLIGGGLWLLRDRLPFTARSSDIRVAVLPFETTGGGEDVVAFSNGLLDETLGALSSDRVQALSRTDSLSLRGPQAEQEFKRLGVDLFLDGTVRKAGDVIKVRVSLNDVRDHTTLWSADLEGSAAGASALQAQVAARSADAAHWALEGRRKGALDPATLADFIVASDSVTHPGGDGETLIRQVVAKAPNFAIAHSRLALLLSRTPGQPIPEFLEAKRREARRALQLDPKTGEAHLMLSLLQPLGAWRTRSDELQQAVAVEPDFAPSYHFQQKFFAQVGRNRDALAAAQRSTTLNPVFLGGDVDDCVRLTLQGVANEAKAQCARADLLWPGDSFNELHQFYIELEGGREAEALQRLRQPVLQQIFQPSGVEGWTRWLRARAAGDGAGVRAAALAADKAADAGTFDRRDAFLVLAMTGQVDAALRQFDLFFTDQRLREGAPQDPLDTSLLFVPATASVRQDPRFMALARRLGLVDYWRWSGVWPDFCAEPGLPYDCKAQAARPTPAHA